MKLASPRVRPGRSEDLAALQPLATATSRNLRLDEELEASRTDGQRCFYVAELGGVPSGFVVAQVVLDEAEIIAIATLQSARRRGTALTLLKTLEESLSARGVLRLLLEVSETNEPARACYRRAGFVPTGHRARYYPDGSDAVLMTRMID